MSSAWKQSTASFIVLLFGARSCIDSCPEPKLAEGDATSNAAVIPSKENGQSMSARKALAHVVSSAIGRVI